MTARAPDGRTLMNLVLTIPNEVEWAFTAASI